MMKTGQILTLNPHPVLIFPNRNVKGGGAKFHPMTFEDALKRRHATDAHCVGYVMPQGAPTARLNLSHLADLIEEGVEPVLNWVFVDIDNEEHAGWTPEAAKEHWLELEGPEELDNAVFYSTRGGYRLVWRLAEPLPVSWAGDFVKQFTQYLHRQGVPVDLQCVAQWNTLFRLPFVHRDGVDLQAHVDTTALEGGLTLQWSPPRPLKRQVKTSVAGISDATAPQLTPLTKEEWQQFNGATGLLEGALGILKSGGRLGQRGSRQNAMFSVAGAVMGHLGAKGAALGFRAMAPSVAARQDEEGAPTLEELWGRLKYLAALEAGKEEAQEKAAKITATGQPPIVYRGSKFFVRNTEHETYVGPIDGVGLCQMLEQHFTTVGVVETTNDKGSLLSPSKLTQRYGRAALQVQYEMGLDAGHYSDKNFGTLHMGCCVGVPVEAKFNPDVAKWLELFAGDHHEKLLDWLATAAQLNDPTCALYIHGAPGTGKGLFASGLAALWGTGATSYNDAVGKFNSALTRNPIVHVDEYFAFFDGQDGFSGAFRSLIGDTTRQLRVKHMSSATLVGCPRLVICANNGDALQINENLTGQDLAAIAQRVLYIKNNPQAADFLRGLGGRVRTKNWVNGPDGSVGAVGQHITWLKENRQVTPGGRFLVEGVMGDWHRDLMGSSGLSGAVLGAVAHYVQRGQYDEGLELYKGDVLVNAPALRRLWGALTGDKSPRETTLVKSLRTLSNDKTVRRRTSTGRLRFYKLNGADVLRTAENLQIGDVDKMKEELEAGGHDATGVNCG